MPWSDTHKARTAAQLTTIRAAVAEINASMLGIPPRFKLVVENDGHRLRLIEEEKEEASADGS